MEDQSIRIIRVLLDLIWGSINKPSLDKNKSHYPKKEVDPAKRAVDPAKRAVDPPKWWQ